ncbi:MAG TPA: bacillithiol biosynthesis deacetylase BshB1 [Chitinophagaceae bacterium]|jgi:bacillithiol biosynthesis deacetylase BshB1|nr:bacillithiol biosynthesis deacetylase BshB1 [Chitinophagaceae bacterium]HAN38992.1 bacillithiol biosynthesis deacetylase BshB1 [Chitinophagaceae bacterium]
MKVDILAFGVHPDDIELGCSGTLIKSIQQGKKVAIVDLTQGELGTRGTAETRAKEAAAAATIMGVHARENLQLADGFFQINEASIRKVIAAIRKYQPSIVLCNAVEDRHPDHGRAAQLVDEAAFLAGLRKVETTDAAGNAQTAWRPTYVMHYIQDRYLQPDFLFDISEVMDKKQAAILAYGTQFNVVEPGNEPTTYISSPDFLDTIVGRNQLFGKRIGVKYAEGFISKKMIGITDFNAIVQHTT